MKKLIYIKLFPVLIALALLLNMVSWLLMKPVAYAETGATIKALFTDSTSACNSWFSTSGINVSTPIDTTANAKEGTAVLRLKLNGNGTPQGRYEWLKILISPLSGNLRDIAALQFWYNPIMARNNVEVGIVCESSGSYPTVRISLNDYLTSQNINITYGDFLWTQVTIPLSYLAANGTYYDGSDAVTTAGSFNWSRIAGMTIGATTENLSAQTNWCRLDDIKLVSYTDPNASPSPTPTSIATSTPAATASPSPSPSSTATPAPASGTVVDDATDMTNVADSYLVQNARWSASGAMGGDVTFFVRKGYDASKASYLVMKTPAGVMKNFEMSAYVTATSKLPFQFYISDTDTNASSFTQVTANTSSLNDGKTGYSGTRYAIPVLPDGVRYMKIVFPSDTTSANYNWDCVIAKIIYDWGPSTTCGRASSPTLQSDNTNVKVNQKIELDFEKPMDMSTLIPANFSIDGGAAIGTIVKDAASPKKCQLVFQPHLDFEKTYTLTILDGVRDIYGLKVSDTTRTFSFTTVPKPVAYIESVSISKNGTNLDTIANGTLNVSATIKSIKQTTDVAFMAVLYKADMLQSIAYSMQPALAQGSRMDFSASVTVPAGTDYYLDIFAWDNLSSMSLITELYRLDANGLNVVELTRTPSADNINELNVKYNTQTYKVEISGKTNISDNGKVTLAIAKADADLRSVDAGTINSKLAYIGNCLTGDQGSFTETVAIDDTKFDDGYYKLYAGTEKAGYKLAKVFYFAKKSTIEGIFDNLNDTALTADKVGANVENAALGLDLSDYNLSYANKQHIAELFVKYRQNFTDANSVQQVLNKAVGIELLSSETDTAKMNGWIVKYGQIIGIDSDFLGNYLNNLSQAVKDVICRSLINFSFNDANDVNNVFIQQSIPAIASDKNDITWNQLEIYLTKTWKNYITIDTASIAKNGLNKADVYKAMLDYNYSSISDIEQRFAAVVAALAHNKGLGGGGGGGSREGVITSGYTTSVLPVITSPENNISFFEDLGSVTWAEDEINALVKQNVLSPAKHFRPNDNITREEFTKIVVLAFGLLDENDKCEFRDVSNNQWFFPYIASAKQKGIINGITADTFGVGQSITRQEMSAILYRVLVKENKIGALNNKADDFADEADIAQYAVSSVKAMRSAGIINGVGDNLFMPQAFATRAQAAVMIYKAVALLQGGK